MITKRFDRRTVGSFVASVALHLVVVAALVQIAFRYPQGHRIGIPKVDHERIQYVTIPARSSANSDGRAASRERGGPAALRPPAAATTGRVTQPSAAPRSQAAGGTGTGAGAAGSRAGVAPIEPDPRIVLEAIQPRVTSTPEAQVERIMSRPLRAYNDSVAIVAAQRKPGDWTIKDKRGGVWGWDTAAIHLGNTAIGRKVFEPWMLYGVLKAQPRLTELRSEALIRRDIMEGAHTAMIHEERALAIDRIRARMDRQKGRLPTLKAGPIP